MNVRLLETASGRMELAETGDQAAPAVIVLHGTPGSWRQAVPLAEDLAAGSRVFLPSRPGYGRTPLASGRSLAAQADLLVAMLDAVGIERAGVIGISGGGPTALTVAHRHAERTDSLVLLCAVNAKVLDVPTLYRFALRVPGLGRAGAALEKRKQRADLADADRLGQRIERDLTPDERVRLREDPRIRGDLERFLRSHADAPLHHKGLANDITSFVAARRAGLDTAVTAPTLIVHGDTDPVVSLDHATAHHRAIEGSRLEVIAGGGHVFLLTHRERTSALVGEHIEKARAR